MSVALQKELGGAEYELAKEGWDRAFIIFNGGEFGVRIVTEFQ